MLQQVEKKTWSGSNTQSDSVRATGVEGRRGEGSAGGGHCLRDSAAARNPGPVTSWGKHPCVTLPPDSSPALLAGLLNYDSKSRIHC